MARALKMVHSLEKGLEFLWGVLSLVLLGGLVMFLAGDWLAMKFMGDTVFEDPQGYAKLCFLYLLAFGSALAVVRSEHLRIDVLEQKLKGRAKAIHGRLLLLVSAGVCGFITQASLSYHKRIGEVGLIGFGDELPVTHSTLSLVIGMGLCAVHFLIKAITWEPTLDTPSLDEQP